MKTTNLALLALALTMGGTLAPSQARAQFEFGNGGGNDESRPAITGFKLNPKTTIKLNFRNANIDAVLGILQKTSGITIVKDPALTGGITLTSAKAVSLKDAFQILETTLGLKNYELRKEGNLLVIAQKRQRDQGQQQAPNIDFSQFQQQNETKVYPIKYANASQVARVVNDVFGGQTGGAGGFGGFQFGGRGGQGGGGNNQQRQQQLQQFAQRFAGQQSQVRASADDFSNSVIVNAPSRNQRDVSDLISKIDKETDQPQNSRVYKLVYASATDAASVLQNVLTANAPRGRGGATTQQQQQNALPAFLRGGGTAGTGTVTADSRTNSVIVTATEDNQKIVQQVLTDLDKPVELASTTFVFPLVNARADEVADLLNQAFGQRTGTNTNRRATTTPAQQRQNTSNNARTNQNNALGRARAENSLQIPLEDPDAENGELLTTVSVQQGGAFGQFFGQNNQNRNNQNTNQTARTADGRIVNVNDLTNQITVIPDSNTNSVIVVAAPGSADLVQQILAQLDKIPEQVMIETIIVEASLDDSTKLGVEFGLNVNNLAGSTGTIGTGFGVQTTPLPTGGRISLTGGDLSVFLNALRTDSRFNVLSTPRIFTTNNQQAQINISQSIPYVLSTRQDTLGGIQYNYDFLDVGIVLTVTPRITANGYVTMDVNQTANELQSFTTFNAPIVNQREANTTVSVLDGETVVLGGIIRNAVTATTNKVPILGDLPLLGSIFRSTTKTNSKTELLVLLRPRIVRDDAEARALRRDSTDRLSLPTREQLKRVLPPEDGPITSPTEPDKDPGAGAGVPPGKNPAKPKEDPVKSPVDPNKKTTPPSTQE